MKYSFQKLANYGALGNQLWQIAGTVGEARRRGVEPAFPSDWFYRPFFEVPDEFFTDDFTDCEDAGEQYFQDISNWYDHRFEIWDMFELSDLTTNMIEERYKNQRFIRTTIHVRRGNNVTPQYASHHPVCSLDYYEQAMDLTGGPFRVVTDSPEWCKQQSLFKDCEFGVGPPEGVDIMELTNATPLGNVEAMLDFAILQYSRALIMSNSSFSWWAAWMRGPADTLTGPTVYPARWYGEPLAHIDTSVMFNRSYADEWIKLDV